MMRRSVVRAAAWGALGLAGGRPALADPEADEDALVKRLAGGMAAVSPRVHLEMPASFSNGYSVPMTLTVDSPMTEADHVRLVRVIAPRNPIVMVATFRFTPRGGRAAVTTRIRLSQPQNVLAVAEMSDGALLMARTWVKVETDGCA